MGILRMCVKKPAMYDWKIVAQSKPYFFLFVFDLGFHTCNPVIKYQPDASCMSSMSGENNCPVPIPRAQRVADRVHLRLAFLPGLEPAARRIWRFTSRRSTD